MIALLTNIVFIIYLQFIEMCTQEISGFNNKRSTCWEQVC